MAVVQFRNYHTAQDPLVEAAATHHTRITWVGSAVPEHIAGLKISFCSDGMLWLGPIDTPVRFTRLAGGQDGGMQVLDLQLSLAVLRMLQVEQMQTA